MKINIASKNAQVFGISLLAFAVSTFSQASTSYESFNVGADTVLQSDRTANLADVKNQLLLSQKEVPAHYIQLPQAELSNSTSTAFTNKSSRQFNKEAQLKIAAMKHKASGLQLVRKASYELGAENTPSTPIVAPPTQEVVQEVAQVAANTPVAVAPKNTIPQSAINQLSNSQQAAASTGSTALGNYQLRKKPYFYQCFHQSAAKYNVPVDLLLAIAQTESRMNTKAVGKNSTSEDLGVMQINTSWLPKLGREFGLQRHHLYEPCTNIDIGAWVLAHNFVQFGYTWNAVGAYNAKSPDKRVIYVRKVADNLAKLRRGEL